MTDPTPGIGLVLDCSDPQRLAEFWAPALGYVSLGDGFRQGRRACTRWAPRRDGST